MKRSIFLILISIMLFGTVTSAMSLRIHTTVQTSASSDDGSSVSSSGLSVRAILGMVGVGYTTSTLSVKPSSGSASDYGSQALDLSLTPPILSMFTVGIGTVIGGSVPKSQNLDKASGSTTFFNFNFGIGPIDLLLGYRMWDVVQKRKSGLENELKYNEVGVGVGFGF